MTRQPKSASDSDRESTQMPPCFGPQNRPTARHKYSPPSSPRRQQRQESGQRGWPWLLDASASISPCKKSSRISVSVRGSTVCTPQCRQLTSNQTTFDQVRSPPTYCPIPGWCGRVSGPKRPPSRQNPRHTEENKRARRSSRLALHYFLWWRHGDSNPEPPACKAGALPIAPCPHKKQPVHTTLVLSMVFTTSGQGVSR